MTQWVGRAWRELEAKRKSAAPDENMFFKAFQRTGALVTITGDYDDHIKPEALPESFFATLQSPAAAATEAKKAPSNFSLPLEEQDSSDDDEDSASEDDAKECKEEQLPRMQGDSEEDDEDSDFIPNDEDEEDEEEAYEEEAYEEEADEEEADEEEEDEEEAEDDDGDDDDDNSVNDIAQQGSDQQEENEESVPDKAELDTWHQRLDGHLGFSGAAALEYSRQVMRNFELLDQEWKAANPGRTMPNRVYDQLDSQARASATPSVRSSRARSPSAAFMYNAARAR